MSTMEQVNGKRTFTEAEFYANGREVMEYAAATGTAVVVDSEGKPMTVISILTEDLPALDI